MQNSRFNSFYKEVRDCADIHESLGKLYPLILVSENKMDLYDVKEKRTYELIQTDEKTSYLPDKILAAFPYENYDQKVSAIVYEEALNTLEGRIFIQHEFVHCYQYDKCELKLKENLEIYKVAMEAKDYMWEIMHPFPYDNHKVKKYLRKLSNFKDDSDKSRIDLFNQLKELKEVLHKMDYEYMIWQMWKEGFARYVENILRDKFRVKENYSHYDNKFDRTVFYQIGDRYFRTFDSKKHVNIEDAFNSLIALQI